VNEHFRRLAHSTATADLENLNDVELARLQEEFRCIGAARAELASKERRIRMNRDIIAGKWQQLMGKVKEQWGKLTDDDLKAVEGKFDKLTGLIREKYGYTKEKAEAEYNRFYDQYVEAKQQQARREAGQH
jgi:uncharacterized protein YjbJ (UPF0337 family)